MNRLCKPACIWVLASFAACGRPERQHGRVTSLEAVSSLEARTRGCESAGPDAGQNFAAYLAGLGGLSRYVAEPYPWVLLLEAYDPSQDDQPPRFELRWLEGRHLGGPRFQVNYDGYPGGDPTAGARQGFGRVALDAGGWVSGATPTLEFPGLDEGPRLTLQEVKLEAQVSLDELGVTVRQGMLSGSVDPAGLPGWSHPNDVTPGPRGFEACAPDGPCEAVSVCVAFEADPLPPEMQE
jgi:hypothetical protein